MFSNSSRRTAEWYLTHIYKFSDADDSPAGHGMVILLDLSLPPNEPTLSVLAAEDTIAECLMIIIITV
ncbi:hypothetical protein FPSE_07521 [Fusarium pseudograminearum CS3096]|uniref:Uncharacterized protein n=1 Tax=Fusarium pseudograminearum (strain CS3096) TaxID=1028729 RepID=K3VDY0_FUSPC|nr:hypothetical protein FPSE_07521 [Fusarium pseudograminearum CS3096]EKJ72292.1 hypothetical protein FPSE_07521 [Fusarium pseudograminearum CS3096]